MSLGSNLIFGALLSPLFLLKKVADNQQRKKGVQTQQSNYRKNGDTSMECLAFDAMHERESLHHREMTGDIHRDIEDDGGPSW